jgi:hypothetical protein
MQYPHWLTVAGAVLVVLGQITGVGQDAVRGSRR